MSRLFTIIRTLSAPACVFISRAFAAGDSYKDTNQGMRKEGTGRRKFLYLLACEQKQRNRKYLQLVPESKEFSREGGGEGGGESFSIFLSIWSRFPRLSLSQK